MSDKKKEELYMNNLQILSFAMTNIRHSAEQSKYLLNNKSLDKEELLEHIKKIISISDSLHNVGSFMARGIEVDAQSLLLEASVDAHFLKLKVADKME